MDFSVERIVQLHTDANRRWHDGEATPQAEQATDVWAVIESQHQANYELWHAEDEARKPLALDHEIAAAKRLIDRTNQRRNDLTERLDELLLASLPEHPGREQAELLSETPGMMIDRLSILSLKLYHTQEEIVRADAPAGHEAPAGHKERNVLRLGVLEAQRDDLADCLGALWNGVVKGQRRFKVYRQLKMYNDPTLNPVLYGAAQGHR